MLEIRFSSQSQPKKGLKTQKPNYAYISLFGLNYHADYDNIDSWFPAIVLITYMYSTLSQSFSTTSISRDIFLVFVRRPAGQCRVKSWKFHRKRCVHLYSSHDDFTHKNSEVQPVRRIYLCTCSLESAREKKIVYM